MRSVVNISDGGNVFPFIVETSLPDKSIVEGMAFAEKSEVSAVMGEGVAFAIDTVDAPEHDTEYRVPYKDMNVVKYGNFTCDPDFIQAMSSSDKIWLTVCIPDQNPSTYTRDAEYSISAVTRIGLVRVVLATKVFKMTDALSLGKPFCSAGYTYHQYIRIPIADPWTICYSDLFQPFRSSYCYESPGTNNCGALLDIEICVLERSADDIPYIKSNRYNSGRNILPISYRDSDYMELRLEEKGDGNRVDYVAELEFNDSFDGDITEYFRETYFIDIGKMVPELVVMDKENIYKVIDLEDIFPDGSDGDTVYRFVSTDQRMRFSSWDDYVEGTSFTSAVRIFDTDGVEVMDIRSNSLPLTRERFSELVGENIELYEEMEIKNVEVLNKMVKKVVSVSRPDDYKSNIMKPVFYRAYQTENIELHPSVSFNVGVDLDQYKSKVDNFSIQIEGMSFPEIGRVPGYVLFKIDGEALPKTYPSGTYYILDGDGVLVTTGKYQYA